jgi:ribosome-binding protein aMBF1 (putative translation factor)
MIAHFGRADYRVEFTTLGPRWRTTATDQWQPVHRYAEEQVWRALQSGASEVWCLRSRDVKAARIALGLSHEALSAASGVDADDLQAIEAGDHIADRDTLDRLARALHA